MMEPTVGPPSVYCGIPYRISSFSAGAVASTSRRSSVTTGFHSSGVDAKNSLNTFERFGIRSRPGPDLVQDFLRAVHAHLSLLHEDLRDPVDLIARRADRGGDVPRVPPRLPALAPP